MITKIKNIVTKCIHGFFYLMNIFLYIFSFPLALLIYSGKEYWLISEIDFDARDNGFAFFKYLREEKREINTIYVISKRNVSYDKVRILGETLEPYSYKHLLIFIAAKYFLSTLINGLTPSPYLDKFLGKYHVFHSKCINLNHGIDKDLYPFAFKSIAKKDLVIAGAFPEYKFILDNYGYSKSEVAYTGLARFDDLYNFRDYKKKITIMPTWRRWLSNLSIQEFCKSDYFVNWMKLLHSPFISKLSSQGYEIYFYIHPVLNKFIDAYRLLPPQINICSSKDNNLQTIILESMLLITDFSSVFFDFAFMGKPIVYYQFDEERFFEQHYLKSSYFSYRLNGFGPVCTYYDALIKELNYYFDNHFHNKKIYLDRADTFFRLHDNKNCERIFAAVSNIK